MTNNSPTEYINSVISKLIDQLKKANVPEEEIVYRQNHLMKAAKRPTNNWTEIHDEFYQQCHEIKSFLFIRQFGETLLSLDNAHTPGCDLILNNTYQIECICAGPGSSKREPNYSDFCYPATINKGFPDYKIIRNFLKERILSAIASKKTYFSEHVCKGSLSLQRPYFVFLGMGILANEMVFGKYGEELLHLLFGVEYPIFDYSNDDGSFLFSGYTYADTFEKYNGALLNNAIFSTNEYADISGIIFSSATLPDMYSTNNTWLFSNPFAKNTFNITDFKDLVIWTQGENALYYAQRNGIRIL